MRAGVPGSSGEDDHEAYCRRGCGGPGRCRGAAGWPVAAVPEAASRPLRELMDDRLLDALLFCPVRMLSQRVEAQPDWEPGGARGDDALGVRRRN